MLNLGPVLIQDDSFEDICNGPVLNKVTFTGHLGLVLQHIFGGNTL